MKEKDTGLLYVLATAVLLLVCAMTCGCTRRIYVPVETTAYRTDTLRLTRLRIDSVHVRDSVTVTQRGDTVYLTRYRDRYRVKERIDTLYQSVTDSVKVRVPYPVERELTAWERTKIELGGWAFGAIVVLAVAVVWFVFRKRQR